MSILEHMPDGGKPFDPYFVPDDWARLQYGRILWKKASTRERLIKHWTDARHPYRDPFVNRYQRVIETVLESDPEEDKELEIRLREAGHSLRTIIREIPPVFGDFF